MVRAAAALLLSTLVVTAPAVAADLTAETLPTAVPAVALAEAPPVDVLRAPIRSVQPRRSMVLPALYVSLGTLQAYDAYSTLKGVKGGAVESNPLMRGVVGHPAAFVAIKAGVTGASIYLAERLWQDKKRTQAILLMVASNGLMAYVAQHNARILGGLK